MPDDPTEILVRPPVDSTVDDAAELGRLLYGLNGRVTELTGERDRNYLIEDSSGNFNLKIANPAEGADVVEMQQLALYHIGTTGRDVAVPRPLTDIKGDLVPRAYLSGVEVPVRVVTYLPGVPVVEKLSTPGLRRSIAFRLAELDLALGRFDHPAAHRTFAWDVTRISLLRPGVVRLQKRHRQMISGWIDRIEKEVVPSLGSLRFQVIHGDFNRTNLLTTQADQELVTGVIDFSDLVWAPLVADVAVAAAYQALGQDQPMAVVADLAGAYHSHVPLTQDEQRVLPFLVMARLIQSITIGAWRASLHPENREYILSDAPAAWGTLLRLDAIDPRQVIEAVQTACR